MNNMISQAIKVIESHRKCADFYTPARVLLESLYDGKWRTIKAKLSKVGDPESDEYYMIGVYELMRRAEFVNAI